ncbi:MAG: SIS domain-containing protein [Mariprofundales bacterium]
MSLFTQYSVALQQTLASSKWEGIARLAEQIIECRQQGNAVFICGNGGSAANAMHIANDLIYAPKGEGVRAIALTANSATLTCIANDIDYKAIFSHQLATQGKAGDLLIALSGSGNSENIVEAIHQANNLKMHTCAILGFNGGACKSLVNTALHFPIDDMQIAEDLQIIIGHMLMRAIAQ